MKKITLSLLLLAVMVVVLTGCSNTEINKNDNEVSSESTKEEIKGNYDVFESIKKVETTQSYEEINSTMGFEGKDITSESAKGWKKYEWEITEDTSLIAVIYESSKTVRYEIEYPDEMIKNKKADFSDVKEFKSKINSADGLNYQDFVKTIGCDGTLDKKSDSSISYSWVNAEGGTLHASFNIKTGKCTIYNGVY